MADGTTGTLDLLEEYRDAQAYTVGLIEGLEPAQVLWRPHDNSSAIGWHLGHQGAVNHFMVRNLTAAEPSFDPAFDKLFDSATPEPSRGALPPVGEILAYRDHIAASTTAIIERIRQGDVGAPEQLAIIADGLMRGVINHEYQHSAWILEVRDTMIDAPAVAPRSTGVVSVDGYFVLG